MKTILTVITIGLIAAIAFAVARNRTPVAGANPVGTEVSTQAPAAGSADTAQIRKSPAADKRRQQPAPSPLAAAEPSGLDPAAFTQTVDVLVTPQSTFAQKQAAWHKLNEAGKLDDAIQDLEQRAATNPKSPEFPAALGQAYLQKAGTLKDIREQGILGMKADQTFDTALTLDAFNWDARFFKAVALSYWPPQLNKGEEVTGHFLTLIQQQEAQPAQPQFAQTYVLLGNQYAKSGNADQARTIWQRGAALFPNDTDLRAKLQVQ